MAEWKSISLTKFKKERAWFWTYVRVFLQGAPLFQLSTLQTKYFQVKTHKVFTMSSYFDSIMFVQFLTTKYKILKSLRRNIMYYMISVNYISCNIR